MLVVIHLLLQRLLLSMLVVVKLGLVHMKIRIPKRGRREVIRVWNGSRLIHLLPFGNLEQLSLIAK